MSTAARDPATDRARLVGAAYATPGPLAARAALYAFERDPVDLAAWVLDRVEAAQPFSATSRVVDIGCGPGRYSIALRARAAAVAAVAFDLSPGMAAASLAEGTPSGVADAMQLPVRTASCSHAIAAHMLYHVPDIALAAARLARVVGPNGLVAIVANGRDHLLELDAVASEAFAAITGLPWTARLRSSARFLLDDAPSLVAPALTVVGVDRMQREIVVTEPAPIVDYVESEESLYDPVMPSGVAWTAVLREVEARVAAVVERSGAFTVHSDVGMLLCRATP